MKWRCEVSKMESSADADLQFGDLQGYASAVNGELRAAVRPETWNPATEVKCLAAAVRKKFKRMADLANQDGTIAEGVAQFFMEALVNFNLIIAQAVKSLPKDADGTPLIHVNIEVGESVESDDEESCEPVATKRSVTTRKAARRASPA